MNEIASKSVLIADDDPQVLDLLADILTRAGYTVTRASDGKEALARMREAPAAVLITDIIMPELEGVETISKLKREFPGVRIIAISGAAGGRYLKIAEMLGANAILKKPFDPSSLLATVKSVLS